MKNTNRLLSLDALRGFDLFFIIGGGSLILALAQFLPASACSLTLFALFYLVIDVVLWRRWTFFFRVIGMNSITIYLAQQFWDFYKPIETVFGGLTGLYPGSLYAVAYWLCYISVCLFFLYFLYSKGVFLKI